MIAHLLTIEVKPTFALMTLPGLTTMHLSLFSLIHAPWLFYQGLVATLLPFITQLFKISQ
jgi:uncharacterized membrane protein YvlD (DUF360 family)